MVFDWTVVFLDLVCLLLCCVSGDNEENQDTVEQILKCIIENEGDKRIAEYYLRFTSVSFCSILSAVNSSNLTNYISE